MSRAIGMASLGAGISYSNLAIALPLLALEEGRSTFLAGSLIALHTAAIALGALSALVLRRPETGVAFGLGLIATGQLILVVPPSTASMAAGALVQGAGHGLFWVGVQAGLGRRAGERGSEQAFVTQYSLYVSGTVAGGVATGLTIAALRAVGLGGSASISLSFLVGAVAVLGALPAVLVWLRHWDARDAVRPRLTLLAGLGLQTPDLFLVGAMGMLVSLAPVVLSDEFEMTPSVIGLAAGLMAVAKISGAFAAGRLARAVGARWTITLMLAGSGVSALLLIEAGQAAVYVALTVAAVFLGVGAWPIMVDGSLARIHPGNRADFTIAWNVREYAAVGATTAVGGYLLDAFASPRVMLGVTAALLGCAALCGLVALRAPLQPPSDPQPHVGVM